MGRLDDMGASRTNRTALSVAVERRSGGSGNRVVVLLHGLVATGDIFGRDFDDPADSVTVVPDLLGFGRSKGETRTHFEPETHLDALDQMLIDLDLADRPLVIGAHPMGAALALRWAARRGAGVERIVCWGAPVYYDADAVDEALVSTGLMARLFAADTRGARRACEWNCRHRTAAGWVAATLAPSMPVTIARAASLHSWPAYRDAMAYLVVTPTGGISPLGSPEPVRRSNSSGARWTASATGATCRRQPACIRLSFGAAATISP